MSLNQTGTVGGVQITDFTSAKSAFRNKSNPVGDGAFVVVQNGDPGTVIHQGGPAPVNLQGKIDSYLEFRLACNLFLAEDAVGYGNLGVIKDKTAAQLGVGQNEQLPQFDMKKITAYRGNSAMDEVDFSNNLIGHAVERLRYVTKDGLDNIEHRNLVLAPVGIVTPGTFTAPSPVFVGTVSVTVSVIDDTTIKIVTDGGQGLYAAGIYKLITDDSLWSAMTTRLAGNDATHIGADVASFLDPSTVYTNLTQHQEVALIVSDYYPEKDLNIPGLSQADKNQYFKMFYLNPRSKWAQNSYFSGLMDQTDNIVINVLNLRASSVIASAIAPAILHRLHKGIDDKAYRLWRDNYGKNVTSLAFVDWIDSIVEEAILDTNNAQSEVQAAYNYFASQKTLEAAFMFIRTIEQRVPCSSLVSLQY